MTELTETTADIVAAYVQNNAVPMAELSALIASVHAALVGLGKPAAAEPPKSPPTVNPKKSVTPDYIVSLEDGRKYKTLKRHLTTRGITPDEYRTKWNLPADYPMVAPSYAARRSDMAKRAGLGRKRKTP